MLTSVFTFLSELVLLFVGGFLAGFLFIEITRLLVSIAESIRIKRWTWKSSGIDVAVFFGLFMAGYCAIGWIIESLLQVLFH